MSNSYQEPSSTPVHEYEDEAYMLLLRARKLLSDILDTDPYADPEGEIQSFETDVNFYLADKTR